MADARDARYLSDEQTEPLSDAERVLAVFVAGSAAHPRWLGSGPMHLREHAIIYACWSLLGSPLARQQLRVACEMLSEVAPVPAKQGEPSDDDPPLGVGA